MSKRALKNQVALITGATKGIGLATAHLLADHGVRLVLNARTADTLNTLQSEMRHRFPAVDVIAVPGNMGKAADVQTLIDTALKHFGQLDIVINNAGVAGKVALLQEIPVDEIDATIDTNLKGPLYLMRLAIPAMVHQGHGIIINVNSIAGKTAYPFWSVYCASKFGLAAVTQAVREEQRMNNIKIVGIYPGAVDTPIWDGINEPGTVVHKENMLDAEDVARTILNVLQQPDKVLIEDVTLVPQIPAL